MTLIKTYYVLITLGGGLMLDHNQAIVCLADAWWKADIFVKLKYVFPNVGRRLMLDHIKAIECFTDVGT